MSRKRGALYMKTNRVEQHRIKKSHKFFHIIDDLCWKSKNMYNYGNFIIRQEFVKTSKEKEEGLRESYLWYQSHNNEVNRKNYIEYIDQNIMK